MKKYKLTLISIFFNTLIVLNAQNVKNEIKICPFLAIPIGHFSDGFKTGYGIALTDYIPTSQTGSLLINLGYNNFKTKGGTITYTGTIVSILAGYRYKKDPLGFYIQGAIGAALYGNIFGNGAKFAFAPGVGYLIKAGSKGAIDLSLNYNVASYGGRSNTWVAVGLGYLTKF